MDNSTTQKFAKQGQDMADQAVDALRSGADAVRSRAGKVRPALDKAASQAKSAVSEVSDSLISYTQDNPLKSLLLAAGAGALLVTLISALNSGD